jgi:hypothetical protein
MPKTMPVEPAYLKVGASGRPVGVDRDKKILRGYVVAQAGPFKDGRGEFNEAGLDSIERLLNAAPNGIKSRFTHPSLSDDGLGKFLGRAHNGYRDSVTVLRDGKPVQVPATRADLHLSETSFATPHGNLGGYVLDLAEKDPEALSSSIVVRPRREERLNPDGTAMKNDKGERLPPLWFAQELHASDIVDTGAAVDGLLSAELAALGLDLDGLPDALQRQGVAMLDQIFEGQPREVVEARVTRYLCRYLDLRFGDPEAEPKRQRIRDRVAQLRRNAG